MYQCSKQFHQNMSTCQRGNANIIMICFFVIFHYRCYAFLWMKEKSAVHNSLLKLTHVHKYVVNNTCLIWMRWGSCAKLAYLCQWSEDWWFTWALFCLLSQFTHHIYVTNLLQPMLQTGSSKAMACAVMSMLKCM